MKLSDVFSGLSTIDRYAQPLLQWAGYEHDGFNGLGVCPKPSDPEEAFLLNTARKLLESLDVLHVTLQYLMQPTHGTYGLELMPGNRYGYHDHDGYPRVFHCGEPVEALIPDMGGDGMPAWVPTRIEHDGSDYYLVGHKKVSLMGLPVRERW